MAQLIHDLIIATYVILGGLSGFVMVYNHRG